MTYLSREIFEFIVDWSEPANMEIRYDLSAINEGFSSPVYERTQEHVLTGWAISLVNLDEAEIDAFDTWIGALNGRSIGFWLPVPFEFGGISDGVSATQFKIENQGLSDTWNTGVDIHLYFTKDGETAKTAKVTGVSTGVEETVTVDTSITVDETWTAWRLRFVRLAEDREEGKFISEGVQTRSIRVVELPQEYGSAGTGSAPVFLYHFTQDHGNGTVSHWRYTSFDVDLSYNSQTWESHPINHSSIVQALHGRFPELTLKTVYDSSTPVSNFVNIQMQSTLELEVLEGVFSSPSTAASVSTVWKGRVVKAEFDGAQITANCKNLSDFANRRFPRLNISTKCNYNLYDSNTCKVVKSSKESTATLGSVGTTPNQVTITDASLAGIIENWFARGTLETGTGSNFERRIILSNTAAAGNTVTLTIGWPLKFASNGQSATVAPGCDLTYGTCDSKFSNSINFGGEPYVPEKNLVINAVENSNPSGNKK